MEALVIEFLTVAFTKFYGAAPVSTVVLTLLAVWYRRRRSRLKAEKITSAEPLFRIGASNVRMLKAGEILSQDKSGSFVGWDVMSPRGARLASRVHDAAYLGGEYMDGVVCSSCSAAVLAYRLLDDGPINVEPCHACASLQPGDDKGYVADLETRFSYVLEQATSGLMSKTSYTWEAMRAAIDDAFTANAEEYAKEENANLREEVAAFKEADRYSAGSRRATPEEWSTSEVRNAKDFEGRYCYKPPHAEAPEVWVILRTAEDEGDKWEFLGVAGSEVEAYCLAGGSPEIGVGPVRIGQLFDPDYKQWDGFRFVSTGQGFDGMQYRASGEGVEAIEATGCGLCTCTIDKPCCEEHKADVERAIGGLGAAMPRKGRS